MRILFILFLGVLVLLLPNLVVAREFVPSVSLFGDEREGAWEYGVVADEQPQEMIFTEDGVSVDFSAGLPAEGVELIGGAWREEAGEGFIRLNDLEKPGFLPENRLIWKIASSADKGVWLRWEYRVWSTETERGFDAPVLAIFHGDRLVYKEDVDGACPVTQRVHNACEWQTRRIYLGKVSEQGVITFLAGDTGDRQKPSGIDVRAMKLEVEKAVEPEQGKNLSLSSVAFSSVAAQQSSDAEPTTRSLEQSSVRSTPTATVSGNGSAGKVLGVRDPAAAEENNQAFWKNIVFHPVFFVLLWVVFFALIFLLARFARQYKSIKKPQ